MESVGTWYWYAGFAVFVVVALMIDLLVLDNKKGAHATFRQALVWSIAWVALALIFNVALWWYLDDKLGRAVANETAAEFFTGYLLEKALAVDNLFVFLMLFTFFGVPPAMPRRALIIGVTAAYHGERFSIVQDGRRWFTPLFVVVAMIGITDVIFAVDSIPAIFAVTLDPFVVLTSNVFAVLGLRALYFMLADLADRFHLLKYGIAFILVFIGIKMLLIDIYKIPVGFALSVVGIVLASSMAASLWITRKPRATFTPTDG